MANSVSMINNSQKVVRMFYILYLVQFQKEKIKVLFDSDNKVNATNLDFVWKLDFKVWKTNIRA